MKKSKKIHKIDMSGLSVKEQFEDIRRDASIRSRKEEYKYECLAILIGLDTGLRASDLLNLKTDSITYNKSKDRYECVSDIKKTGVKNHKTLLYSNTYDIFKSLNLPDGYIFTNPKTGNLFTRIWLTKRTNLRYGFSFHTLRKISAKRLLEVGTIADAQRHLAHKRISSTNTYLKVGEEDSLDRVGKLYH
jgi:integrase